MDKYRNFGWKPKYNFGDSQNITLTKSKYNLRSKYNRTSEPAPLTLNSPFTVFEKSGFQNPNSGGFYNISQDCIRSDMLSARCGLKIVIASEEGVPKRYFCTFGGKEYESIRQAFVACDN